MLGLNTAGRSAPTARRAVARPAPIRSCILIFYYGGPSHLDTWDMKPDAPREVRGEFRPIATNVPGIRVSEHLPHSARVVDRLAIVRSLHHPMTNHNAAAFAALSGRPPRRATWNSWPTTATTRLAWARCSATSSPSAAGLPTFVALPHVMHNVVKLPGQIAGFLGSAHDPFQVAADPNAPDFRLDELELPGDVSLDRLDRRESLLRRADAPRARPRHGARRVPREGGPTCSAPRRVRRAFDSTRRTRSSATATAAPSTARACCWRAGWSRRASGS